MYISIICGSKVINNSVGAYRRTYYLMRLHSLCYGAPQTRLLTSCEYVHFTGTFSWMCKRILPNAQKHSKRAFIILCICIYYIYTGKHVHSCTKPHSVFFVHMHMFIYLTTLQLNELVFIYTNSSIYTCVHLHAAQFSVPECHYQWWLIPWPARGRYAAPEDTHHDTPAPGDALWPHPA